LTLSFQYRIVLSSLTDMSSFYQSSDIKISYLREFFVDGCDKIGELFDVNLRVVILIKFIYQRLQVNFLNLIAALIAVRHRVVF
jgi:hypothetical protein